MAINLLPDIGLNRSFKNALSVKEFNDSDRPPTIPVGSSCVLVCEASDNEPRLSPDWFKNRLYPNRKLLAYNSGKELFIREEHEGFHYMTNGNLIKEMLGFPDSEDVKIFGTNFVELSDGRLVFGNYNQSKAYIHNTRFPGNYDVTEPLGTGCMFPLCDHNDNIYFTPHAPNKGRRLTITDSKGKVIKQLSMKSGGERGYGTALWCNAEKTKILILPFDGINELTLYDTITSSFEYVPIEGYGTKNMFWSGAPLPDGRIVLSPGAHGIPVMFNYVTKKMVKMQKVTTPDSHGPIVYLGNDKVMLLCNGNSKTCYIYDTQSGKIALEVKVKHKIGSGALLPNGKVFLASLKSHYLCTIYDPTTNTQQTILKPKMVGEAGGRLTSTGDYYTSLNESGRWWCVKNIAGQRIPYEMISSHMFAHF